MTDKEDTLTRTLGFYGKTDGGTEYRMWSEKFLARAHRKGYKEVLLGKVTPPKEDKTIDESTVDGKKEAKARKQNEDAYMDLIAVMMDTVCFSKVSEAKTDDLPSGDANLAWKNLIDRYRPNTKARVVELKKEFASSKLSGGEDPDLWIDNLEYIRSQLKSLKHTVTDDDLMIHVINNVPKEYNMQVAVLERELESGLTVKKLKDTLRGWYTRLKKQGGGEYKTETEDAALFAGNKKWRPKKQFKGICKNCGKYGHKAVGCPTKEEEDDDNTHSRRFNGKCHNCGKYGHMAKDCWNNNHANLALSTVEGYAL
jgi:hypothetical protein